ncbi:G-protein coupled receptor 52-like [Lytechinus pictus]|uniref:G-protein coupled receptor 52-like n=1 Tax=Lytechinus pictus TaxID=7653 RepID=UPI0030B9CD23
MNLTHEANSTSVFVRDVEPLTMLIYVAVLVTEVVLNIAVLTVITQQTELQEYMIILYRTLATLDMLLGIVWCTWSFVWFYAQSLWNCTVASKVFPFLQRCLILSAMACLCGISFNLYLLITRPLRYHIVVTKQRFFLVLALTLIVIILICLVYLPIPYSSFSEITNAVIARCLNRRVGILTDQTHAIDALLIVVPVCIALVFTLIIYGKLLVIVYKKRRVDVNIRLRRQARAIWVLQRKNANADHDNLPRRRPSNNALELSGQMVEEQNAGFYKRFKGIITVLLLYGSFCAVWIPYIVHFSLDQEPSWLEMFLDVIALSNTWTQPMVYLLTNEEARKLCCKFLKRYCIL